MRDNVHSASLLSKQFMQLPQSGLKPGFNRGLGGFYQFWKRIQLSYTGGGILPASPQYSKGHKRHKQEDRD